MPIYEKSIDCAMRHIKVARDNFALHHETEFDIDWAMEQFDHVLDILERLKGYEPQEWPKWED